MIKYNIIEHTNPPKTLSNAWVVSIFRPSKIKMLVTKHFKYVQEIKTTIDTLPYVLKDWMLVVLYDDSFENPKSNFQEINKLFFSIKEYGMSKSYVNFIKIEVPQYKNTYYKNDTY